MASNINVANINTAFPIAGKDNPTSNFRTNFFEISNNLQIAHDEISNLQLQVGNISSNLSLSITGDVTAPSVALSGNTTLNVSLISRKLGTQTFDSSSEDVVMSVNDSGIVTAFKLSNNSGGESVTNDIQVTTVSTTNGSSTSEIDVPVFTVGANGKITDTTTKKITFGILGFNITENSVVIGNSSNKSDTITPTATGQVLQYYQNTTQWRQIQISDIGGLNISAAESGQVLMYNGTNWVPSNVQGGGSSFDPNSIIPKTIVNDDMNFIVSEADSSGNVVLESISTSPMISYLEDKIQFKLQDDKTPTLGGPLNLNGQSITSQSNLSVDISGQYSLTASTGVNVVSGNTNFSVNSETFLVTSNNGSVSFVSSGTSGLSNIQITPDQIVITSNSFKVNGSGATIGSVTYTGTPPSATGMFLTSDASGNTSWTSSSIDVNDLFDNITIGTATTSNSNIMVFDSSTKTVSAIPEKSLISYGSSFYYVSANNGNDDTGDGSVLSPYKSLNKLFSYFSSISNTFDTVVIYLDYGTYECGNQTIPSNITNVHIYGINNSVEISGTTGIFNMNNSSIHIENVELLGSIQTTSSTFTLKNCNLSLCTITSTNATSILLDNITCASATFIASGYTECIMKTLSDPLFSSTISLGSSTATSDSSIAIFNECEITTINMYSGNYIFNNCSFYKLFNSTVSPSANYLTLNNCNFLDYVPGYSFPCNVHYLNTISVYTSNCNRSFYGTTSASVGITTCNVTTYSSISDYQVINLVSDVVVLNLKYQTISASGGTIHLALSSTYNKIFRCTLIINTDFSNSQTGTIQFFNTKVLNNYMGDTTISSVGYSLPSSSFGSTSGNQYFPTVSVSLPKAYKNGSNTSLPTSSVVYDILCNYNISESISSGNVTGSHSIITSMNIAPP